MASIFGIRLIILFLVTSLFSRRDFVEMLVIPWWDLSFCGLLWSFVTFRCFCMMVCGAKCNFYGYCRILWYL